MKASHCIEIFAPQSDVWRATLDVENWPGWTPTVEYVERKTPGDIAPGSIVLIKQPQLPETEWRVSAVQPESLFIWHATIRGIPAIASHRIERTPNGVTNHLGFEMTGLLAWLLWPLIGPQIRRTLETENNGLKAYCEGTAAKKGA